MMWLSLMRMNNMWNINVREILYHCEERGISLNCANCCPQVHFAGFMLTPEGYPISNAMIDAITNFLTPSSCTDLHSFICLTNQFMTCT